MLLIALLVIAVAGIAAAMVADEMANARVIEAVNRPTVYAGNGLYSDSSPTDQKGI